MARNASEEQTNVVYEEELKPRIAEASEFIDEDNDDDDDDDDDSHSDDSDGHDNDDYDDSKDAQNTSQSTQNTVAASGDDKQKSKSRFRHVKALGTKMRSVLPNMKTKPDRSFEATIKELQHKIRELKDEKVVVESKMEQMKLEKNMEMEAVIKERDDLQADVTRLQSRIEDLMTKLEEIKRREHIAECIKLNHISGMLWKRGVLGPTGRMWRHRWFTASNDGRLYYYRKRGDNAIPRGFIDIKKITEVQDLPSSEGNDEKSCFNVVTPKRTFEIRAKDEEEKKRWLNALDHLRYWTKEEASFNEGKNIRCTENH
ncbi:uncharacterized protein [Montipora foliosa]|uniref:uncharacterized protein isoform X2 n=1 Tax=Montipora foliosa TaxID=591990 RepID=UPI0035F18197